MTYNWTMTVSSLAVEKLVVARHGAYVSGYLDDRGEENVRGLAAQIGIFLGPDYTQHGVTLVLSSEATRARETADIISELLGLTCISSVALGDEHGKEFLGSWVAERLASFLNSYQGIIAVTHEPQTDYLPEYMHPNVRGGQGRMRYTCAHGFDQAGNDFLITPNEITPPRRMK